MKRSLLSLLVFGLNALAFAALPESGDASSPKSDPYPLQTCVVSGEPLGGMGEPYVLMFKQDGKPDREVRFCCEMCVARFNSNPAKYLAQLDAAAAGSTDHAMMGDETKACCAEGTCAKCAAEKANHPEKN